MVKNNKLFCVLLSLQDQPVWIWPFDFIFQSFDLMAFFFLVFCFLERKNKTLIFFTFSMNLNTIALKQLIGAHGMVVRSEFLVRKLITRWTFLWLFDENIVTRNKQKYRWCEYTGKRGKRRNWIKSTHGIYRTLYECTNTLAPLNYRLYFCGSYAVIKCLRIHTHTHIPTVWMNASTRIIMRNRWLE